LRRPQTSAASWRISASSTLSLFITRRFGPDILLDDLLARIAANCPKRRARGNQYVPKCHAWFDDLAGDGKPDILEKPAITHEPQPTRP
jgi:hypothetical protein